MAKTDLKGDVLITLYFFACPDYLTQIRKAGPKTISRSMHSVVKNAAPHLTPRETVSSNKSQH